jgi:predicted double-glycine peptidase
MIARSMTILGLGLSFFPIAARPEPSAIKEPGAQMLIRTRWFEHPTQTWVGLRRQNVVMQQFDYSCGAAALATLMRFYFQDAVTEADVLKQILSRMNPEELADREKAGLSLLDLKQCAERMGYQAVGVKLKFAHLPKLQGPILIHLARDDYKHFAVFRGVFGDRIYLADPSRGNVRQPVWRFAEDWTGFALVLGKEGTPVLHNFPLELKESELTQNEYLAVRSALRRPL